MLTLLVPLLAFTPSVRAEVLPVGAKVIMFFTDDNTVDNPRVKELSDTLLTDWFGPDNQPTNITGRERLWIQATYEDDGTVPELLGPSAQLYFTIDGSQPRKSGPNVSMERIDADQGVTLYTYEGSILSAALSGAVRLKFMIELRDPADEGTACDFGKPPTDNPAGRMSQSACPSQAPFGSGFQTHIDRTRPVFDLATLRPAWIRDIWSNGMAVTSNPSMELAFNVTDSALNTNSVFNTRLNPATLKVSVKFDSPEGNNATIKLFDNGSLPNNASKLGNRLNLSTLEDGFKAAFSWNRSTIFSHTFFPNGNASVWWDGDGGVDIEKWGENGNHTLTVTGFDYAGNDMGSAPTGQKFHVDTRAPTLFLDPLHSFATPSIREQDPVFGQVSHIVGVGSQVHIQVNVTDFTTNISRTNATAVRVHLENTSLNIRTPDFPLFYNQTTIPGRKIGPSTVVNTTNQYKGTLNITHFVNRTSGLEVSRPTANFTLRYNFTVMDSVGNRCAWTTALGGCLTLAAFTVRPNILVVNPLPVAGVTVGGTRFVGAGPYSLAVNATGPEDIQSATLTIRNATGRFLDLSGWTRVNDNTFERAMNTPQAPSTNWTQLIPRAEDGTRIQYNISAQDTVGNVGRSPAAATVFHEIIVDTQPPTIGEALNQSWRGPSPHNFTFAVIDPVPSTVPAVLSSGPNATSGFLNYRVGSSGDFINRSMAFTNGSGASGLFNVSIPVTVAHLDTVQYFAGAADNIGNWAANGTSAAPRSYRVDLVKPVATLNATPATTDTGVFRLSGLGTDADSGVKSFVFEGQFRSPGAATFSGWIQLQEITLTSATASRSFTSDELCLVGGGVTYQFRAVAIDDAGNRGDPSTAQTTDIPGLGCANELVLTIQQPSPGSLVDAQGGEGTKVIAYTATATGSFISDALILMKIEFSPDNGVHYVTLADGTPNTGQFEWKVNAPTCTQCRIRLTGTLPDGTSETIEGDIFEITRGNRLVDFDGNGMGDSCELEAFGALGVADPRADPDGDGLTNQQECAYGTDPKDADTDDDGAEDGVEIDLGTNPLEASSKPSPQAMRYTQWDDYVWIVPALFALVTIVFLVGLARRW